MDKETIRKLIACGLDCKELEVHGDDGQHFEATIVAQAFEGKSRVQRHQLVYAALGEQMGNAIHSLSFKTLAPSERSNEK
jgi:acid stress-induced BolA-like protein IbaG/YrbA